MASPRIEEGKAAREDGYPPHKTPGPEIRLTISKLNSTVEKHHRDTSLECRRDLLNNGSTSGAQASLN
ncbi:hypothetical protein C0Q70_18666 [Pomacea canaliculata]|uniref:Uncharacterized protein n=1 Tax=Pomacea canaliculata TaxID=400727 RepID=A0A2T7NH62_POMCA|nr:hypothetical protein C0Q70_18666 [Pomacea canaliculata]